MPISFMRLWPWALPVGCEFVVVPGENEMQALADGCLRVLGGEETAHIYG